MSELPVPQDPISDQAMPADIQASAFFLADHVVVENGKLYVNGGFWNQVHSPGYPVSKAFGIAAVLHVPWNRHHEEHAFTITFQDADGGVLPARFDGQFRVGTAPNMRVGDFTIIPIAALATNFVLSQPGDFAALLSVDEVVLARWRFRAVRSSGPTPGTEAGPGAEPDRRDL
jgi:hypothetical protein